MKPLIIALLFIVILSYTACIFSMLELLLEPTETKITKLALPRVAEQTFQRVVNGAERVYEGEAVRYIAVSSEGFLIKRCNPKDANGVADEDIEPFSEGMIETTNFK